MKETRLLMGMPITVEIADQSATQAAIDDIFDYFDQIDQRFSTYKETSEISRINRGELGENEYSEDMKKVFALSEKTKQETNGYFDIQRADGTYDPSGMVKGWAIYNAAQRLGKMGYMNFYVEAGGDIQTSGKNSEGELWRVGIQNPFTEEKEIIKVVTIENRGIATSGNYVRGYHIYNPHKRDENEKDIVSLSVIGPNVYEADRFATAAFAMGRRGIHFIDSLEGFEGYMIDNKGIATMTREFQKYTIS